MERPRALPDDAPVRDRSVTFIARDADGELVFTTSVGGKKETLQSTTGPLWAVWTGRWTSHLFTLDRTRAAEALAG